MKPARSIFLVTTVRPVMASDTRTATREIVARAVSDAGSMVRRLGEPDEAGVRILHRAPDLTVSAALHVYDGDFFAVARSMWNSASLIEEPYDLAAVLTVPVEGGREVC